MIVAFNGDISAGGHATNNVFALNGDIRVSGTVDGSVTAPNGRVTVANTGTVNGDIRSRYSPIVSSGATVTGDIGTINAANATKSFLVVSRIALWLTVSVSTLLLGLLAMWLAPRVADASFRTATTATGATIGWGVLLGVGLPIVAGLALLTVLAAPLGAGLFAAMGTIYAFSYVTGAWLLGKLILRQHTGHVVPFLLGWAILRAFAMLPIVGTIGWVVMPIFGLGSLGVALWRSRRTGGESPQAQAAPAEPRPSTFGGASPA